MLDLFALIERRAARNDVRNRLGSQHILDNAGKSIGGFTVGAVDKLSGAKSVLQE